MKTSIALVFTATLLAGSDAMCPNRCSERGICGAFDRCSCYAGFTNGDCSGRICPYGKSWADIKDTSVSNREPHYYEECSGKGLCNRESGLCECLEGFQGSSCQRMACPENCSGHGSCNLMSDSNSGYALWDADRIQVCACDPGWTGNACNERMCKLGDDPMSVYDATGTQTESDEEQVIQIQLTGADTDSESTYVLGYTDWRGEEFKTHPIEFPPTVHSIEEALEALPNNAIPSITVSAITQNTLNRDYTFTVTFTDSETPGNQPGLNVYVDGCIEHGCQPVFHGVYHSTRGTVAVATVTETDGTSERTECSSRGICNKENGICECFEGFYGESCNQQTIIM